MTRFYLSTTTHQKVMINLNEPVLSDHLNWRDHRILIWNNFKSTNISAMKFCVHVKHNCMLMDTEYQY